MFLWALILAAASVRRIASQTCLRSPPVASWKDGTNGPQFDLNMDAASWAPQGLGTRFWTRMYNGMIPGPTLSMKRGTAYYVTLNNKLGPNSPQDQDIINTIHGANTTNIHTHGLHISGMFPGDTVFNQLPPQSGASSSVTYEYQIPCDHIAGVHWYHPHLHGSSTLQVGGGAAGLILIEDSPLDGMGTQLASMETLDIFIQFFDLRYLSNIDSLDRVIRWVGTTTRFYLLNGQYRPTICINRNEWHRFRIGHSDVQANVAIQITTTSGASTASCTIMLIARDGVPIRNPPRRVRNNIIFFTMSSRNEIAVSCSQSGTYVLKATRSIPPAMMGAQRGMNGTHNSSRRLQMGGQCGRNMQMGSTTVYNNIGTIEVTGSRTTNAPTLQPISPNFPVYLPNLINLTPGPNQNPPWTEYTNSGAGGMMNPCPRGVSYRWCVANTPTTLNGVPFGGETAYSTSLIVGSYNEWYSPTAMNHPFHPHINHLQLTRIERTGFGEPAGWSVVGDYVDTAAAAGDYRFYAHRYGGNQIMHCHILQHEDCGAMGLSSIVGGCDARCQDFPTDSYFYHPSFPCNPAGCKCT